MMGFLLCKHCRAAEGNCFSFCYHLFSFFSLIADASYSDPLGPQLQRPMTAARRREDIQDEFADEELGDDLLPE